MDTELEFLEVGRRIRNLRRTRGWTLEQLSERTRLSSSYLSQIENARANLHLRVLRDIAQALGVPMVSFLQDGEVEDVTVVRCTQRRAYRLASGAMESLLYLHNRLDLEVTLMEIPPGIDSGAPSSHPGDEFTYVLTGRVRTWIGGDRCYDLDTGDIIYYRSTLSHHWENPFDEPTQILISNTPATF